MLVVEYHVIVTLSVLGNLMWLYAWGGLSECTSGLLAATGCMVGVGATFARDWAGISQGVRKGPSWGMVFWPSLQAVGMVAWMIAIVAVPREGCTVGAIGWVFAVLAMCLAGAYLAFLAIRFIRGRRHRKAEVQADYVLDSKPSPWQATDRYLRGMIKQGESGR